MRQEVLAARRLEKAGPDPPGRQREPAPRGAEILTWTHETGC